MILKSLWGSGEVGVGCGSGGGFTDHGGGVLTDEGGEDTEQLSVGAHGEYVGELLGEFPNRT